MAKKNLAKEPLPKATKTATPTGKSSLFQLANILPLAFCSLYFVIHFIPDLQAYDAMGPQWLYMVLIDLVVVIYLVGRKDSYQDATAGLLKNNFSRLYLAFFALAGISIFTAINPTEAWVCYARLIATIVAFFNIGILLYGRIDLFKWLAQILCGILLVESIQTLREFFAGFDNMEMADLIKNLKGSAGNKNIFAAALVMKIPFVLYCIHTFKLWGKVVNILILLLSSLTLFLINARASYLSLFLITALYIVYCLLEYKKDKRLEPALYRISYLLLPLLAAFFISQIQLSSLKSIQDEKVKQDFGTVTERLGSIGTLSDESNKVRLRLWQHAADYTMEHPLIGCGYGNWKIASIPYQRTITNELYVPIHAHNDLVEVFAELGIPGGLLYLALFICLTFFAVRTYYSDTDEETKYVAIFSFLAFAGYSVDALLNFPSERPISQLFFALLAALITFAYIHSREKKEAPAKNPTVLKPVFALLSLLFLLPAAYITYLSYRSQVIQRIIIPDLGNEPLRLDYKEIFPKIPSIPNISVSAQPLEAIKGRYLYESGKYEEALVLLNRAIAANPLIGYSEFLKAGVFYRLNKMDSAQINAEKAFYTRPRANTYYQTYMAVLAKTKDTVAIKKAFLEYDRYRHTSTGWNLYVVAMMNALERLPASLPRLLVTIDSGLRVFPRDTLLPLRRAELVRFMSSASTATIVNPAVNFAKAQAYYDAGIAAFNKAKAGAPPANRADYTVAARNFLKAAEITPGNYIIYENIGVSYFNMGEYARSISYFDRVINMKTAMDGKSEYFKGVALYNLGKRDEGCSFMRIASSRGYKEADAILKNNCK